MTCSMCVQKREEYLQGLRQVLQQNPELASTLVSQQGQQDSQAAGQMPQLTVNASGGSAAAPGSANVSPEDAARLMQAFGANAAGNAPMGFAQNGCGSSFSSFWCITGCLLLGQRTRAYNYQSDQPPPKGFEL